MLTINPIRFTQPNYKTTKATNNQSFKGSQHNVLSEKSVKILNQVLDDSRKYFDDKSKLVFSRHDAETQTYARMSILDKMKNLYRVSLDTFPTLRMRMDCILGKEAKSEGNIIEPIGTIKKYTCEIGLDNKEYNESTVEELISRYFGTKQ